MRDPYTVLGIARSASEKEVKSAYRSLAKRYHPDSNSNDPRAKEKFAEIGRAYELLGDKDKRGQFDRGEIDAEGKPKFQGFEGFAGGGAHGFNAGHGQAGQAGAEDLINELFGGVFGRGGAGRTRTFRAGGGPGGFEQAFSGGAQPERGGDRDIRAQANVTVEELARGKGTVRLPSGKTLSFAIAAGASDGQTIRLAGQGEHRPGTKPGDALVTLHFVRHPVFEVDGSDLRMQGDLPLATAVTGGRVAVETLDGKVALSVPPWTDSGKVFRLKGKGLPKKGGGHGDLLVTLAIRLQERDRDALTALMRRQGDTG